LNIAGGNLYIETTFNNQLFEGNSSPYFSIKPIPYCCVNIPYSYNNGAIDPNGDSLVTDMVRPLDGSVCGPGSAITFLGATPPISLPSNPFQTNNTFVTNSGTGQLSFTPIQAGAHTMTTRVSEYRNGILIGYIMRDVQVQVLNCTTVAPYITDTPYNVTGGGHGVNTTILACVDQNLQFDFHIKHSDPTSIFLAEDNHIFSIPTATIVYTNLGKDSVHGHFSWTPTLLDAGSTKTLIVTAKDSTCKPPGIMLYYTKAFPIYTMPPVSTVPDTSICPNETAYLNATGGGNYLWSVLPGGSPITSLSCTTCTAPVATPAINTRYVVTSLASSFCNNNKDTVLVSVLPGLVFQNLIDTVTCPQNSVVLDLKSNPPSGVKYKFKWTPATFLNSDTLGAPTTTPTSPITYRVMITSSGNACKAYDTVTVDVLTGFKVLTPDTVVCSGANVNVNASGDSRYTYTWTTTSPFPGLFNNASIVNPIISPAPAMAKHTYMLKATYGVCRPDSQFFDIEVEPVPSVTVDDDNSMCQEDTMKLHGVVLPTGFPFDLTWTPGASLNNNKIAQPIFTAQQTTTLKLTATSPKAGCTSFDTVRLVVFPSTFLHPTGDTAICPGNKTQLHAVGDGLSKFRWYPEFNISDKTGANPWVSPTTTTTYTIYGVDTNACLDTASVKVVVHPGAVISMPHEVKIYPGESYQMEPITNCTYFSWFPKVGLDKDYISNPVAKPEVNTRYLVTARSEAGCTTSDSITVMVSTESIVDVPNAFSPGSNPNATFKVLRRGDATLKSFTIFNRWGQKVFETSDINKGWDGTLNGQAQPMGVYVYSVEGVTPSGKKFNKQGNVTLIR
jgi:gliding motility-associated-like protein